MSSQHSLSAAEKDLLLNPEMIYLKNSAMEKLRLILISLQEEQAEVIRMANVKHLVLKNSPKISKGENYLGLPYFILDYPRYSDQHNMFFIRSMFWWGNFFSSTIQLSGEMKENYGARLLDDQERLTHYYIGINEDPWIHHFEPSNYTSVGRLTKNEIAERLKNTAHLKIATYWPLSRIDDAKGLLLESWIKILQTTGLVP